MNTTKKISIIIQVLIWITIWVLVSLFWSNIESDSITFKFFVGFLYTAKNAALIYFSYLYLLPKLFLKARYVKYGLLLVLSLVIVSFAAHGVRSLDKSANNIIFSHSHLEISESATLSNQERFLLDSITNNYVGTIEAMDFLSDTTLHKFEKDNSAISVFAGSADKEDYTFYSELQPVLAIKFGFYFVLNLILIFITTSFYLVYIGISNRFTLEKVEKEKAKTELKLLREKNNPHFLFNALNNVYMLIPSNPDLAQKTLLQLSEMLRFQLYETNDDKIALQQELDYISNYIELEKLRTGKSLSIEYSINGNASSITIEPFILFTFVENAFKHGVSESIEECFIKINLDISDLALHFTIKNSIPANTSVNNVGGFGLDSVKKRLEMSYSNKHNLEITSKAQTFSVDLKIELDEN